MKSGFNNKKISSFRGRVVCLLFACILLIGLEFLSRLVILYQDNLEPILKILQQDSALFWKQKPNLNINFQNTQVKVNSFGLRGEDIQLNKDEGAFRIICLGGSPTFGWGVDYKDAYPYQLQELLREKYGSKKNIEVINAGNIGYSSYQGVNFLKRDILKFSPDLITVAYVINDVDKHRFYRSNGRSDKELLPKNKVSVAIENFLDKSNIFKLLKASIVHSKGIAAKHFSQGEKDVYLEKRRVSLEDYRKNLNQIVDIATKNNIEVVFIKMPVNLPAKKKASDSLKLKANSCFDKAFEYANNGEYNQAIGQLKEALGYTPYSSKAYYYLGVYSQRQKKFNKASNYFQKAKKMELFQCGSLSKFYNKTMQEIAVRRKIPLVNIVLTFAAFSKANSKYLFLDPEGDTIHPNAIGHKIIGRQVYATLVKYYFVDK